MKIINTLLILLAFKLAICQTAVYHPYPQSYAKWKYESVVSIGGPIYSYQERVWFPKDTAINLINYQMSNGNGFIRQDVSNQKIFFLETTTNQEYDLSIDQFLNVGDTINLTNYKKLGISPQSFDYKDSVYVIVDQVEIDNNGRVDYRFDSIVFNTISSAQMIGEYCSGRFSSGIGVILYSGLEFGSHLICHSVDLNLLYGFGLNPQIDYCVLGNEEDYLSKFEIFPNPANSTLQLAGDFQGIVSYRIYNVHGKLLTECKNYNINSEVDISKLELGVHFIQIEIENQKRTFKFIKL